MPMSESDKRKVLNMLNKLDKGKRDSVTSSKKSFEEWLRNTLYNIYCKVKDVLQSFWDWLCSLFI